MEAEQPRRGRTDELLHPERLAQLEDRVVPAVGLRQPSAVALSTPPPPGVCGAWLRGQVRLRGPAGRTGEHEKVSADLDELGRLLGSHDAVRSIARRHGCQRQREQQHALERHRGVGRPGGESRRLHTRCKRLRCKTFTVVRCIDARHAMMVRSAACAVRFMVRFYSCIVPGRQFRREGISKLVQVFVD